MDGIKAKEVLARAGVTQAALAQKMRISPQALSALLSSASIKSGTLEDIAAALGKDMSIFYGDPSITNSNTGSVGGDFSVGSDMTRVLEILDSQLKTKDEQLRSKDEQINALIKALNR